MSFLSPQIIYSGYLCAGRLYPRVDRKNPSSRHPFIGAQNKSPRKFGAMHYDWLMPPLLDIRDVHIHFGPTKAVSGISLQLDEGEVLGLVGESGSGKSATALAILGLLGKAAQVKGNIFWRAANSDGTQVALAPNNLPDVGDSIDLLRQSQAALRRLRGREIAMIFQEPMTALNPVMSIGRQVAECFEAHASSWTGREAKRKAIAALEAVS